MYSILEKKIIVLKKFFIHMIYESLKENNIKIVFSFLS